MTFDDELRETMRAHDPEAPTVATLGDTPWLPSRRRMWLPVAAAAAVVVATAAIAVALSGSGHGRNTAHPNPLTSTSTSNVAVSAPRCPHAYKLTPDDPWVPQTRNSISSADRLVPATTPSAAVVCAYNGGGRALDRALTGTRELASASLPNVPAGLAWIPAHLPAWDICPTYLAATDGDAYLVGLSYPTGVVWVSVIGHHCKGAGNGTFRTNVNLRPDAARAFATGAWPAPPVKPCGWSYGRIGQQNAMVPGRPVAATVCRVVFPGAHRPVVTVIGAKQLAKALNTLETKRSNAECREIRTPDHQGYTVVFRYASGPPVIVRAHNDCIPRIDNGSLQSDDWAGFIAALNAAGVR